MDHVDIVLRDVTKPVVHVHVSYSAIYFDLYYMALKSEKREVKASTRKISGVPGDETMVKEIIDLWPVFQIRDLEMTYSSVVIIHQ